MLQHVSESEWPPGVHASFATMLSIWGENDTALALVESHLRENNSDQLEYASNLYAKGFILQHFDRHNEARALYQEALGVTQHLGAHHLTVQLMAHTAVTSLHLGDQDEVIPMCEAALELGNYQYTPLLKIFLTVLYLHKQRYGDGLRLVNEIIEANADSNFIGHAWAYKVEALAGLGKDASGAAEAALDRLERSDFPNTHALILGNVLEFGSPEQKRRALPLVADIPKNLLLSYHRDRLEKALAQLKHHG